MGQLCWQCDELLGGTVDLGAGAAAGATDWTIEAGQGLAGASADIGLGSLDWLAEGSTEAAGSLGDLTTDPLLAFAGLDGLLGGGDSGQEQPQDPDEEPLFSGLDLTMIVLLVGLGAAAWLVFGRGS